MRILEKLNQRELELLKKIDIIIEDRDYEWEELEEIKEDIVLNGEISSMNEKQNVTALSEEYSNLADKFVEFED